MRNLIALAIGLCIAFTTTAQPPEKTQEALKRVLLKELTKRKQKDSLLDIYNAAKSGKGNGTFSTNITTIQTYFISKRSVQQFEQTLNNYQRMPCEYLEGGSSPEYAYVMSGRNDESDMFRVQYQDNKAGKLTDIQVEFGLDGIIKTITYRLTEDNINTDKTGSYINRIKSAGYTYDIASTRIGQSYNPLVVYAKHTSNKVRVRILPSEYGTLITVMRSYN